MSAEYVMASGNEKVILCERGIRTYELYTKHARYQRDSGAAGT
jgi:3-deoxy-7-phosphoheptulonate synthase